MFQKVKPFNFRFWPPPQKKLVQTLNTDLKGFPQSKSLQEIDDVIGEYHPATSNRKLAIFERETFVKPRDDENGFPLTPAQKVSLIPFLLDS